MFNFKPARDTVIDSILTFQTLSHNQDAIILAKLSIEFSLMS